jgi:hypothetical protein
MSSKTFVSLLAITAARRVVATALVCGLSMIVHFTSPAGEKPPAPAAITTNDDAQIFYNDRPTGCLQPIGFRCAEPLGFTGCSVAGEISMPTPSMWRLFLTSTGKPASSLHALAHRRSRDACDGSHGGNPRMPEKA